MRIRGIEIPKLISMSGYEEAYQNGYRAGKRYTGDLVRLQAQTLDLLADELKRVKKG